MRLNSVLLHLMPCLVMVGLCSATMVPRMSLEQLTDGSQIIVHGRIVRSWSAWDEGHQFIWTHHELKVIDPLKGPAKPTVTFSEPGGTVDGVSMNIAGTPRFTPGEEAVLFLYQTPIGYVRTTGWGQGKYNISERRVHTNLRAVELVSPKGAARRSAETSLEALDGMSLADFKTTVRSAIQNKRPRETRE
jgi:hypothetical protein